MKRALDAFVARRRDDFRPCLTWQGAEIERAVDLKLRVRPPLWDPLRRSQKICTVIGAYLRRFSYYNDMGTGKSLIGMALAAYFREAEGATRFIVLVPNRVNISGWLAQVKKHAPELRAEAMPSKTEEKFALLADADAPLLIIETYAGFARMCSVLTQVKDKKGKVKNVMAADPKILRQVAKLIGGMILDKSSAVGHHDTLQTEVVTKIASLKPALADLSLVRHPLRT